jgi:type II secretory pathway predicted ATPase ExeA
MILDVMNMYGFERELKPKEFFETLSSQGLMADLRTAIGKGYLFTVTGDIGVGKTATIKHIRRSLEESKDVIVSTSFAIDKERVGLGTLMSALLDDLAEELGDTAPRAPEKRERFLQKLIAKKRKPVVLMVDEAHDLPPKTLVGLKRLSEVVADGGGCLAVVLVGHPRLKQELRMVSKEEIGARTMCFELRGIEGLERAYFEWLLAQSLKPGVKPTDVFTPEAMNLIVTKLRTPLHMEHYAWRSLEEGLLLAQKPVGTEVVLEVIARDIDSLESRLSRSGYCAGRLAEMLDVKLVEMRDFMKGRLPAVRVGEIESEMRGLGILARA